MPTTLIKNGTIILNNSIHKNTFVLIEGGRIMSVGKSRAPKAAVTIDARGCYVAPGFIDSHIHGDPASILSHEIKYGTTSIVVAESCAPLGEFYKKCETIRKFMRRDPLGPAVLGFRMEGPYISRKKAGAQDRRYIRKPDRVELGAMLKACAPELKMMTVAPELKGAAALIRLLVAGGVQPSIGHSYATCGEAEGGIRAGISHATHIFNAMRPTASLEPGVVGAVLSDGRVWAEIILDRIHVHEALFGLLVQAKGLDKVVLVTDSIRACPGKGVKRTAGAYRFASGRLAGSALTMIEAVRNAVRCGLAIPDAVRLATVNPARLFGVGRRKGAIAPGKDADLVIFDKNFDVNMTIMRGRIMFRKRGF